MAPTMPTVDNRPACDDGRISELAELTRIDCVHLDDVSVEDAKLALLGVALYHHLEPAGRRAFANYIDSLPTGFRGAVRRAKENHRDGAVIYENDSGSQQIVRGRRFDYASLGIEPQRMRAHDIDFHYVLIDGNFVFFPDNPHFYYYIQSARQGTLNASTAALTRKATQYLTPYFVGDRLKRIPGLQKQIDRMNKTQESIGFWSFIGFLATADENIPIWSSIIGTPVPSAGSTSVLIYISRNRQDWNHRLRLDITSDGTVRPKSWEA